MIASILFAIQIPPLKTVLLADDDLELCELLQQYLQGEDFHVELSHDGAQAAEKVLGGDYDLLILDVMLPGLNGFDVLRKVRQASQTPILMLTAKGDEIDRIVGLELGADDYLAKPCSPRELVARMRTIIRRAELIPGGHPLTEPAEPIVLDDLWLDLGRREVKVSDREITLTGAEFDVLVWLMQHAGSLVSRSELSVNCLGRELSAYDRSVDMHVSNLRKKLGPGTSGERIKTVRGLGYQYVALGA